MAKDNVQFRRIRGRIVPIKTKERRRKAASAVEKAGIATRAGAGVAIGVASVGVVKAAKNKRILNIKPKSLSALKRFGYAGILASAAGTAYKRKYERAQQNQSGRSRLKAGDFFRGFIKGEVGAFGGTLAGIGSAAGALYLKKKFRMGRTNRGKTGLIR